LQKRDYAPRRLDTIALSIRHENGTNMTIAELGSLGEFIASFGVLITLIYLVIQLRQNTKAIQLSTAHSVTEELQQMFGLMASDRGLSEIFVKAGQNTELMGADRVRFYTLVSNLVRVYENAFLQNRQNVIDKAHWDGMTRMMIDISAMPAFSLFWADRMHWFSEEFQQHMNVEIIPTPAKPGINIPGNYLK
jgi:hypothetical protein